jgi:exonuclease SbcC
MLLKNLKLHNFARFTEADINLQDYNRALIVGIINNDAGDSNGSGKTSLIDAIGWCVWGESKAKAVDENVKVRTTMCSVSLEFEHDGKDCSITRTRDKSKGLTTINFYINGALSNGKTVIDTNKKIVSFLRLDYSTYVNSVYLRQDDIFSFADNGTNKEGRDILEKVLGLEEYDLYQDEAKAEVKRIEREIEVAKLSMEANADVDQKAEQAKTQLVERKSRRVALDANLTSKQAEINSAKQLVASLALEKEEFQKTQFGIRELGLVVESKKNEVNSLIRKFNTDSESSKAKTSELESIAAGLADVQSRIAAHENSIITNDAIKKDIESVESKIATEKRSGLREAEKFVSISSEVRSNKNKIDELKEERIFKTKRMESGPDSKDVCPECLTEITLDTIDHFKKHLGKDINGLELKIEGLNNELTLKSQEEKSINEEIARINSSISSLDVERLSLSKILLSDSQIAERSKNLAKEKAACDRAASDLDLIKKSTVLEALKSEIETKKALYLSKKQELETKLASSPKTQFDDSRIRSAEEAIRTISDELDSIKQSIHIVVAEVKNCETALDSFDIIKKEIDKHKLSIDANKKDLSIFMRLQEAFSSKGIRADIIQNAIAELEKHSNELLGKLTSGRLSVEFKTKKEVKASRGEQVEKVVFEVIVNDGEDPLPFHLYSGGEKFRVAFVLRVALAQLLQRRANSKLEFLIIDEAFSPLDRNGIEKNLAVIDVLQNEFKTILVITHRDDIKQYFDQVITVFRDASGSRIL